MDSKTRIKNFISQNFPDWEKVDYAEFGEEVNFKKDLCDIFRIKNGEQILIAYTNISITGSDRPKPQLRVFLDEYKNHFLFAKKKQMRFYLLSIFTKEDSMAKGLDNFNPKDYIISIETNLDIEGARRDLRSIYDYANETLNGDKFLKCTRTNYSSDINQASFIYIGSESAPEKDIFEAFINIFDSRPYINSTFDIDKNRVVAIDNNDIYENLQDLRYLRAMRTKPFLLLAGISGTGKSRIVKEMAFDSCPDNSDLRKDPTSPGNYCLIEVKPNWHDSSELVGYLSQIGRPHYVTTTFIKFLVKAMMHPETPFFVCLDEMNLAPVEQYFAEFLSVLESRKLIGGKITSEPIIKADIFKNNELKDRLMADIFGLNREKATYDGISASMTKINITQEQSSIYDILSEEGLRIPSNVIVIGTVNMDETTHQFSRKVIDRAMTIEMNLPDGNPFMDFYNSREPGYRETPFEASHYLPTKVSASEALEELAENNAEKTEWLKGEIAKILTDLNDQLESTPFKIAYRVQNELVLFFYEVWRENSDAKWREILTEAVDQILMMKVLPRVEGDEDLLEAPLAKLAYFCEPYPNAKNKVQEMKERLERANFTSFWP